MTFRYSDHVRVVKCTDKSLLGKVGIIRMFDQIFEKIALVEFDEGKKLAFIHTDNLEKVWSYFDENGLGDEEEEKEEKE